MLLVAYATYNLARPTFTPVKSNATADLGIGVLNGLLGGLTGLGGVISTIWVQLGGGPKDAQRAIFQPVLFLTMTMTTLTFAASGHLFNVDILKLFLLGLPALLLGLWVGVIPLRKTRRCGVSQSHPGLAAGFRIVAGLAGILPLTACPR